MKKIKISKLKKPNLKYILLYLREKRNEEGYSVKELSRELGIHKENLRKYLRELEEKDLIDIIRDKYEMKIITK